MGCCDVYTGKLLLPLLPNSSSLFFLDGYT
jgi:hypothetical protein